MECDSKNWLPVIPTVAFKFLSETNFKAANYQTSLTWAWNGKFFQEISRLSPCRNFIKIWPVETKRSAYGGWNISYSTRSMSSICYLSIAFCRKHKEKEAEKGPFLNASLKVWKKVYLWVRSARGAERRGRCRGRRTWRSWRRGGASRRAGGWRWCRRCRRRSRWWGSAGRSASGPCRDGTRSGWIKSCLKWKSGPNVIGVAQMLFKWLNCYFSYLGVSIKVA